MKLTYEKANELLQGRWKSSRKVDNNTYLMRCPFNDDIMLKLHKTFIITFQKDGTIKYNTGGWKTRTTKDRLNKFSNLRLWQDRGVWYFKEKWNDFMYSYDDIKTLVFEDGLTQNPDRTFDKSTLGKDPKATFKLRKRVAKYANDYITAFRAGKVPAPSNGDCIFCHMVDVETNKPIKDASHIMSHISEKYYVPSLIVNAIDWRGSKANHWMLQEVWENKSDKLKLLELINNHNGIFGDWQWKQITTTLKRYILRELGEVG